MIMPLWLADQPLVLASKSEVRRTVLAAAEVPIEVVPADIDERGIEVQAAAAGPDGIAALLAREKARAVAAKLPGRLVLGADQTLALAAARAQLKMLRGKTHELHAAIALVRDDTVLFEYCAVARLTLRDFSDEFLEAYIKVAGNALTASVGAYQMEKVGIQLFERIEGDHFTILGLPLLPLLHYLRQAHYAAR
jgi:nucleoside triphosphate pyrophosphatase